MGQQAAVTLNSVVYTPAGTNNGITTWASRAGDYAKGFSFLTQSMKTTTSQTGSSRNKVEYRLSVPIVEASDTAFTAAGTLLRSSNIDFLFNVDGNSTLAERTDLYLRAKDLLASTLLVDSVESLDPAYG